MRTWPARFAVLLLLASACAPDAGDEPRRTVTVSGPEAEVARFVAAQEASRPGLAVERPPRHPGRARVVLVLPQGATGDDQVAVSEQAMAARLTVRIP